MPEHPAWQAPGGGRADAGARVEKDRREQLNDLVRPSATENGVHSRCPDADAGVVEVRYAGRQVRLVAGDGETVQARRAYPSRDSSVRELLAVVGGDVESSSVGTPPRLFAHSRRPIGQQPAESSGAEVGVRHARQRHESRPDGVRVQKSGQLVSVWGSNQPVGARRA